MVVVAFGLIESDLPAWTPPEGFQSTPEMVADVTARATAIAPCLAGVLTSAQDALARAILRGVVLRMREQTTGGAQVTSVTSGPFGYSTAQTQQQPRGLFWPSEIAELQALCAAITGGSQRARMGWML